MDKKDLENISDEELVMLAKHNREYEEYLLNKYKNLVKSRAKAYFISGGDNDDLVQEGMIGLFKAIRDYDPGKQSSFSSFAELCIKRQIYTAIKTAGRQKHQPLNTYISLNKPMSEDISERTLSETLAGREAVDPESLYLKNEKLRSIEKEINEKLSALEKRVLILHLQGLTYSEISEIINKPTKSIDNALQRIKKKLDENQ
ncbi:MAG TPA: RNA polymerase sporulation sigma factor SigH [Candidatus Monoglobus merdigallinarum]|uniref:RNA polymerase sporulation sigma factor SigH n=1 Tax=Candidatus Monoglobus merdigallinarum TaxID=2838698 RepID=A0A9D1PSV8_9FIRM|nr:RNA polymerase sporulation sigma factor SigH [Candidatus Monoglobus merdigallinarum]